MRTAAQPWYASDAWPNPVTSTQCIHVEGHRGYTAEVWLLHDDEGTVRYAGRVLSPKKEILPESVHLSVNELIAETGAMAHLAGLTARLPSERQRRRHTALRVLFRRTGKPPRLPARWFPVGVLVQSGGYWWVSNRYIDTERPFWQRNDKAVTKV